ncbi:MAG: tetratricopeptide repeat protein [Gammaproteobacteria bacterium]
MALLTACTSAPTSRPDVPVEERLPSPRPSPEPAVTVLEPPATILRELPPPAESEVTPPPPATAPATTVEQPAVSPAVVALLENARTHAAAGDGEQAAASLERALRIEPRNPWLWHRLGVLRLQQENYRAAIELANRSNALAASDQRLQMGNWELIARAKTGLGDSAGARQARLQIERLRSR